MLYTLKYINNEKLQVVSQTTVLKFYVTKIFCVWWWQKMKALAKWMLIKFSTKKSDRQSYTYITKNKDQYIGTFTQNKSEYCKFLIKCCGIHKSRETLQETPLTDFNISLLI